MACGHDKAEFHPEKDERMNTARLFGKLAGMLATVASLIAFFHIDAACAADPSLITPDTTVVLDVPTGTAATACAVPSSPTAPVQLQRSFHDSFDTLVLDGTGWLPHYDGGYDPVGRRWLGYDWMVKRTLLGNREMELYVDDGYKGRSNTPMRKNPFVIKDGVLRIVAEPTPPEIQSAAYDYPYVSGMLQSRGMFSQQYGYFEVKAKVPTGRGLWPAFWLLPTDRSWPPELDIIEMRGYEPTLALGAVHWLNSDGSISRSGCRTVTPTATSEFHVYGALITPQKITWFIDRVAVSEINTPPGFDKTFYMVLNLAVGGNWPGTPDADTIFPASFEIDWVSAYAWNNSVQ